jgi:hypothetical protein
LRNASVCSSVLEGDHARQPREHPKALGLLGHGRRRNARQCGALVAALEHGGKLPGVRFALGPGLVELLAQRGAFLVVVVGRQDQYFHAALEFVAAAVAGGHAAQPGALGLHGGRGVGAQDDAHANVLAIATNGDGRAHAAAVPHQDVQHAAQLRLVAKHLGSSAGLDLHPRLGGDLPEQRGQVETAAARVRPGQGLGVQRREHLHHVVEGVERGANVFVASDRRRHGSWRDTTHHGHALAEPRSGPLGLLCE